MYFSMGPTAVAGAAVLGFGLTSVSGNESAPRRLAMTAHHSAVKLSAATSSESHSLPLLAVALVVILFGWWLVALAAKRGRP